MAGVTSQTDLHKVAQPTMAAGTSNDPKLLYLAWVRTTNPVAYITALRKITGKPRSLGGLGDDLTASFISPDMTSVVDSTQISPDVQAALDTVTPQTDWFTSFTNAISNTAQTYLQTSAQANLLSINTQRARQGLPPLTAGGIPVTAASLAPANSSIYQLERTIAGTVTPNFLLIAGVGVLALMLFAGRSRA